jgi:hypothetical protein
MNIRIKLLPYEKFKKDKYTHMLNDLKSDTIILVDAKLTPEEESQLIEETMKRVSERFSGIEMSSVDIMGDSKASGFERLRNSMVEMILGKKRGMTIIGPAKIIHKIKKNPQELLLYI